MLVMKGSRSRRSAIVGERADPARRLRSIQLIYNAGVAYDVQVMTGVAAYLQEQARYSVFVEDSALKAGPANRSWSADGVIADLNDPAIARQAQRRKRPVVGFGVAWNAGGSAIPYFYANNGLIGRLAADHLLDRGFRRLAFCGYPSRPSFEWSGQRERAFVARIEERGLRASSYYVSDAGRRGPAANDTALRSWLQALPKPVGIMAANDRLGRRVLEVCRTCDLAVPYEVAVIGVDNDELFCQLSSPPLSSVEQGAKRLGYSAAALLDRILDGYEPSARKFVIDPVGVVARQSTDVLAADDADVAKAVRFIYQHAAERVAVPDVVRATALSRSALEARFHAVLHTTIAGTVRRVQLERVRRLVSETVIPLKQVAADSGFKSVQHMTKSFVKAFGRTPAKYRRGDGTLLE
jgi:LacI family transcriptional regulator